MSKDVKEDWGEFAEQAADGSTPTAIQIPIPITEPIESVNDNKVLDENHIDMSMNKDVKEDWGEFAEQAADGSTSTPTAIQIPITLTEPIEASIDNLPINDQPTLIDNQDDQDEEEDWGDFDQSSNVSSAPHEETKMQENIDLPTINHIVNVSTVVDLQLNPKFHEKFDQIRKLFNNNVK